jgi:4-amino-4-deoxy-L-arabinose transferase-like glycosyltransferase
MFFLSCCALAYLGLLWAAGYILLGLVVGPATRHPLEILGLAGILGGAVVPTVFFWLSLAGLAPSRGLLGALGAFDLAALFWLARSGRLVRLAWPRPDWAKLDWLMLPFALMLGWLLWAATRQAVTLPLADWDAFANTGFRAKALYLDAIPNLHKYFHDLSLNFTPLDYPMLMAFMTAGSYAAMGEINEPLGKLTVVFLLWAYLFFLYGVLRSLLPRPVALALAAVALCMPATLKFGVQGIPDLPLAIFYAASIFYLVRWIDGGPRSDLALAVILSAAGVFTKNEGLPLAVMNLLAAAAFGWRKQPHFLRDLALATGAGLVGLLPWLIFRHTLPHVSEDYPGHLNLATIAAHAQRMPVVLGTFADRMFFNWNWSLDWFLVFGIFFAADWVRPSWPARVTLLLLLAQLALYVLIYEISAYALPALLTETVDRLLMHAWPAGVLMAAFSLAPFFPRGRNLGAV